MPDITMCSGEGCNQKDNCYRHTAISNEYRQSYFVGAPWKTIGIADRQSCDYFAPNSIYLTSLPR